MMASIQYTEVAILDLDQAFHHLAVTRSSRDAAERLLARLRDAIELLADFPELGVDRSEWKPGLRMLVKDSYVILYSVLDDGVLVERVLEAHQDIAGMFEQE